MNIGKSRNARHSYELTLTDYIVCEELLYVMRYVVDVGLKEAQKIHGDRTK